jgi:hypothetical protein
MQEKRPRSTTISSTTVSSMPPGAPGALPVLPLGVCWQLQDAPGYHLSRGCHVAFNTNLSISVNEDVTSSSSLGPQIKSNADSVSMI